MSASAGMRPRYFEQMAFERRREVRLANASLKPCPPLAEYRLRLIIETNERQSIKLIALCSDGVRVEAIEAVEGSPRRLARRCVGPAVAVFPIAVCVRPNQEPETLNEPVVSCAAGNGAAHILGQAARLR